MQGRRVWVALAASVLGFCCREAGADDASSEAAAAAPRAAELRRVSERPSRVPMGAVKLAPRPSPRPAGAASGVLRVPLSSQLDATSAPAPSADSFGIAAGAGRIDTSAANAPVLELPANRSAIITSKSGKAAVEREELSVEQKTALPWLVVESEREASSSTLRAARPFLTLARAVRWDGATARHEAEFLFGLDAEQGSSGPLQDPMDIRFGVTCEDVAPGQARIATIGPAGYSTVKVSCSREVKNERAQQQLELFAGDGHLSYAFSIPRRAGPPRLFASASRIFGFGFESVVLTATQVEEDGSPLAVDEDRVYHLTSSSGALDASELVIKKGTSDASVQLRPDGITDLEIVASFGALRSESVRVALSWPVVPLGAMLSGGALGGLISAFTTGRNKRQYRRVPEGAAIGLLVALAALIVPSIGAIPVDLLGTGLGSFVVAALAGFAGVPLVERLAALVFPSLKREAPHPADPAEPPPPAPANAPRPSSLPPSGPSA
jgi:hypothetical protein